MTVTENLSIHFRIIGRNCIFLFTGFQNLVIMIASLLNIKNNQENQCHCSCCNHQPSPHCIRHIFPHTFFMLSIACLRQFFPLDPQPSSSYFSFYFFKCVRHIHLFPALLSVCTCLPCKPLPIWKSAALRLWRRASARHIISHFSKGVQSPVLDK